MARTPEQRAARMEQLKEERQQRMEAAAQERAASNPMLNPTVRPAAPQTDPGSVQYYGWIGGAGSGRWKLYEVDKATATPAQIASAQNRASGGETQATLTSAVGANTVPSPTQAAATAATTTRPTTVTQTATASVTTQATTVTPTTVTTSAVTATPVTTTVTTAAPVVTATTFETLTPTRRGIFDVLSDRFNQYGLGSLVPRIRELIINGATEDTITIQLQESPEYQSRFRANQDRIRRGLRALTPGEYLNVEDSYRQILRAYGLNQFDNDAYVSQFISNDISAAELSSRVVNAVQRVRNADPAISKTLRDFYGIGQNDLVAYVLDPNQQLPRIERQLAAAEIGTAARRQGIETGVGVAEQLAAQGISQAEAQKGYATIADILPTAEKLSDIYKGVEEEYRLAEAEQEVFNTLASAQRRRQRLTQREAAAFSGQAGLGRTSLTQESGGQF